MGTIWHWLILFIFAVLWGIPIRKIAIRAGLNQWIALACILFPIGPLIAIWYLAFARWNANVPIYDLKNGKFER